MLTTLLLATVVATSFPGPGRCSSPDGRYSIVCKEASATEAHRLVLKNRASGTSSLIHSFNRHVSVLWAPDSRHFAITDWVGSDGSNVVVMAGAAPSTPIVLNPARIRAGGSIQLAEDHHLYVEASRWLSGQELLLRVHGYGEVHPNGFERFFVYNIHAQSIIERPAGT